jgi:GcrA cell cycle regulator
MSFVWSKATVGLLFQLYMQEGRSAAEAARALGEGVTRNAVLGKVQRLGWSRLKPQIQAQAAAAPRVQRVRTPARRRPPFGRDIPLPRLRDIPIPTTARLWTLRQAGQCAYPVGEPEQPGLQLSCCAPTNGGVYCVSHRALMVLPDSQLTRKDEDAIAEIARRTA